MRMFALRSKWRLFLASLRPSTSSNKADDATVVTFGTHFHGSNISLLCLLLQRQNLIGFYSCDRARITYSVLRVKCFLFGVGMVPLAQVGPPWVYTVRTALLTPAWADRLQASDQAPPLPSSSCPVLPTHPWVVDTIGNKCAWFSGAMCVRSDIIPVY